MNTGAANSIFLSHTDESSKDETRVCGCKSKTCNSGEIDTNGIEVAQQIKLSGCPTNSHFSAKSDTNASFWYMGFSNPNENQLGFHIKYCLFLH